MTKYFLALLVGLFVIVFLSVYFYRKSKGGRTKEGYTNNLPVLSLYFASWCPHCKGLVPAEDFEKLKETGDMTGFTGLWGKVKNELESQGIAKVQVFEEGLHKDVMARKNISGFPTIRLEVNGEEENYDGPRNVDAIKAWVVSKKSM